MKIACIDLEGVLIPELWPKIAQASGIESLSEYFQNLETACCVGHMVFMVADLMPVSLKYAV